MTRAHNARITLASLVADSPLHSDNESARVLGGSSPDGDALPSVQKVHLRSRLCDVDDDELTRSRMTFPRKATAFYGLVEDIQPNPLDGTLHLEYAA